MELHLSRFPKQDKVLPHSCCDAIDKDEKKAEAKAKLSFEYSRLKNGYLEISCTNTKKNIIQFLSRFKEIEYIVEVQVADFKLV